MKHMVMARNRKIAERKMIGGMRRTHTHGGGCSRKEIPADIIRTTASSRRRVETDADIT